MAMKFTVIARGTHSVEWPRLAVRVNGQVIGEAEIKDRTEVDFDIELDQDSNQIHIDYINKQEHHTLMANGEILTDQSLELQQIRINDILLDNWFLTQGHYYPNYFAGFLQLAPNADTKLKSQLIWHFPGTFEFDAVPCESKFWHWYRDQRRYIHIKKYSDREDYREESYIGSYDPYPELIQEIKDIIRVQ